MTLSVPVYMKEHIVERRDGCSNGNWRVIFRRGDEETVVTHTEIRPLSWHGQRHYLKDALRKLLVD